MIKVNAKEFLGAIEAASVGAGKGFVLVIEPTETDLGEGRKAQLASISSSDGMKTGFTNFRIETDEKERTTVSISSNLRPAAVSLAKVTDFIHLELRDTCVRLTDGKEESEVLVERLAKQDIVLDLPTSPEDSVAFIVNREKFTSAVRMGGYCAGDNAVKVGFDCICFRVDAAAKELWIASMRSEAVCRAVVPLEDVYDLSKESGQWHMINHRFIQRMLSQLVGDQIQIGFTSKFMVVQCATGLFGSKKSEGTFADVYARLLSDTEYDFRGKVLKKDLLTGMEIAQVGSDAPCLVFETNENGTLKVTRADGSNRATVAQKEHEGMMPGTCYGCDLLKMIMGSYKESDFYYFGKSADAKGKSFLRTVGESEGIRYSAVLAPINRDKVDKQEAGNK